MYKIVDKLIVRDLKIRVLSKKRDFCGVLFTAPLFLDKWCGVATNSLCTKNKKN